MREKKKKKQEKEKRKRKVRDPKFSVNRTNLFFSLSSLDEEKSMVYNQMTPF